jgi:uncharacterized membrane protein YphA (DoxX/SURF4 family)
MSIPPIYVEIKIHAPLDELWYHTQEPSVHQRWDLRFTRITYLPKEAEAEPQRFTYETRIGFGLRVAGTGESTGQQSRDGQSASALKFESADPKSLIEKGSGYWKYIEVDDGIRFLTLYDYSTRYGAVGRWIDRLFFRPLLGWATAWSFDRLRLWLERGIDPTLSLIRSVVQAICRVALALIFVYHGLVPKLLVQHEQELAMIRASGITTGMDQAVLFAFGIFEVIFGVLLLLLWRSRGIYLLSVVLLIAFALSALVVNPGVFLAPFNPFSL